MISSSIQVSDYQRKHREDVLSLLFYSSRTHSHLDWYKASQWLSMPDNFVQVAYDGNHLVGFLGVSSPLNHTSWIRLAGIAQNYDATEILRLLWNGLFPQIYATQTETVSILTVNPWLNEHLPHIGFNYLEHVVTLIRSENILPQSISHNLSIRNGYVEDLQDILNIDHAAFAPPWQLSAVDIRYAQRYASSCTVAEYDSEIIAYEISTRHDTSGHLARLGVHPKMQGQQVGAVLLDNLLQRFGARGVDSMTVNTQESNIISQRLYYRYGFLRNGFDIPIWQYQVM